MAKKVAFNKLLEPSCLGKAKTKNRLIKTASGTMLLGDDGYINERHKAYYNAIAKGGVGLIIIEDCAVEYPLGAHHPPFQLRIDEDKYIPSYKELTETIHQHNCLALLQLLHSGAWDLLHFRTGKSRSSSYLSADELPGPMFDTPRELTLIEIEELVDKFASASARAKEAGFDGVEINGATCHLINSFLSRFWNRRQDDYGYQNLENRARFAVEIIKETRRRVGRDFIIGFLINGAEYGIEKGTTIQEAQGFARILEAAGIDSIQVRAHGYGSYATMLRPENLFYPEPPPQRVKELDWSHKGAGATVPLATAIKKVVSIPVITVGRLDPIMGEKILQAGKADFIGFARRLMADPELPRKIASGRTEDIAPCTACNECNTAVRVALPVRCRVNAALGGEKDFYNISPADKRKRVLVIGGGPAGMEAARVAAIRGHEVILYEKESKLGGLLSLAAMVKGQDIEDLPALVRYLKSQISKLGVKIRLGDEIDPQTIKEVQPDVVILATGSLPTTPEIPGINRRNVVSSSKLHQQLKTYLRFLSPQVLRWLTKFWMPIGHRVLIIGGQLQGCELAEFLIKRGRKVTIVDTAETLGEGLAGERKPRFLEWLTKKGATTLTGVEYDGITAKGLTIITKEGQKQIIEADTILPATPPIPNDKLVDALRGMVPVIYVIGDCQKPRLIIDSIADGYRVARSI